MNKPGETSRKLLPAACLLLLASMALPAGAQTDGLEPVFATGTDAVEAPEHSGGEGIEPPPPPRARSIELDQPVIMEEPPLEPAVIPAAPSEPTAASAETAAPDPNSVLEITAGAQPTGIEAPDDIRVAPGIQPLVILGAEVPPRTATRLSWSPSHSLEGIATPTPVLIVNGAQPGPVLCLTAALHGDELNGIEIVRRILYDLDPEQLSGTVIGVPIVNLQGFHRSSRYLADRRDLNRYFPGNPAGSSASRIAYSFFEEVIRHCDALLDLHTASFHRTNMPQLRADLRDPKVRELTQGFGATVVLHSVGASGTLRRSAVDAGIPAVTLEAGESMRLQERAVEHGVKGIVTLMSQMGMIARFRFWGDPEPVYYRSVWVRADQGGILFSTVDLADTVEEGDLLGEVTDPITNIKQGIVSPYNGRVIGMAVNQVVLPGFAAFHIAIRAPDPVVEPAPDSLEDTGADLAEAEGPAGKEPEPAAESPMTEDPDELDTEQTVLDAPDSDNFDE